METNPHLKKTADFHKVSNTYQKINKKVALALTNGVGTMTTFWLFCILSLCSLPSVLSEFGVFSHTFPGWMVKASIIALVAWIAQTFFQLVLLPALMVGQNLQNVAADERSSKTFEDVEQLKDLLNPDTPGGITTIIEIINEREKTSQS